MTAVKQIPAAKIERRDVFVESAAEVGKTFSAKAEKDGDDLVTVAHLKIADLMVPREALDLLIGWPEGMAASRFYSELGEPLAYFTIALDGRPSGLRARDAPGARRRDEERHREAVHPAALGRWVAAVRAAARHGWIEKVGSAPARSSNHSLKVTWRRVPK